MFFAHGFKTAQSGLCTIMADFQACKNVPYFSSPSFLYLPNQRNGQPVSVDERTNKQRNGPPKPPERLGNGLHNNAEWIRENRFIFQNVGNESMECPVNKFSGFDIEPSIVECIMKSSQNSEPCHRV